MNPSKQNRNRRPISRQNISRQNSSRRSLFDSASAAGIEALEQRLFLSAVPVGTRLNPAVVKLVSLNQLDSRTASIDKQAGAQLFTGMTSVGKKSVAADVISTSYTPFSLDIAGIKSMLAKAPLEFTKAASKPLLMVIPMPDGSFQRFNVVEAPIMQDGLAKKFPTIKTYRGQGVDDPTATLRMDYTPLGFHAQVLSPKGAYYIEPYWHLDQSTYISYFGANALAQNSWQDLTPINAVSPVTASKASASSLASAVSPSLTAPTVNGTQLKTYRLAVAADGEYTAFFGGTVTAGMSAVVTAINRVDGVYESELGIRMVLVANDNLVIYTNSTTDPYTNNNGSTMLSQNQSTMDSVIGTANYDAGHVFSTGGGGISGLGVVGKSGQKAESVTGSPSPTGDSYWIDYVAHEMGHEWGANHTFNSTQSNCGGGNRNASTAYEPGSGISIMAYAGICGVDDLDPHSIAYFNWKSIDEIIAYTSSGSGLSSAVVTATGNTPPTVSAGLDYAIPANTAFALTATGSDPNGDAITFDWQEADKGVSTLLTAADNGTSPRFIERVPTTTPTRTLPVLASVLAGSNTDTGPNGSLWDEGFTVARTSTWRVIARDNKSGGGGIATDDMVLSVAASTGFNLTSQNSATTWGGGTNQTITWNVANTTSAPINTSAVNIYLSTDGGATFPVTLASAVANNGSATITVPSNLITSQARVKIVPTNSIYFDINNINFSITSTQSVAPGAPLLRAVSDTGISNSDGVTKLNNGDVSNELSFDIPNTINGAAVALYVDGTQIGSGTGNGGTITITTTGAFTISNNVHNFTSRQTDGVLPQSSDSPALAVTIDTAAPTLVAPPVLSVSPTITATYVFNEDLGASINSLGTASVNMFNNTTNSAVSASSYTYNAGTKTATYTFTSLPDGYYTALSNASDLAGNVVNTTGYGFIYGSLNGESFYVRQNDAQTGYEVYKNTGVDGSPDITAPYASISQIFFQGNAGDDTVTLDSSNGSVMPPGDALRFVGAGGNNTLNVTHGTSFTFANDPATDSQNLALNVTSGSSVTINAPVSHFAAVTLVDSNAHLPQNGNSLVVVTGLSITNGGFDLADNDMIIDYASAAPSPMSSVAGLISDARDGGAWDGGGLDASVAQNTPHVVGLGAIEATDYKTARNNPSATFDGEALDNSAIVIKYTYYGDVNLDGKVNGSDYAHIDSTFNAEPSAGHIGGWYNGDFDYNGKVDGGDYSLIDAAFNSQVYGVL